MLINNTEPKKIQVSYDKYGKLMDKLVQNIKTSNINFSCVHGLPRGGLAIAVHLSHFLQIPLIINIKQFLNEYSRDSTVLVVDDIIDTGRTFQRFLDIANINNIKFKTAVVYRKDHASYEPDFFAEDSSDWIVFPWEHPDEKPNREMYEILGGTIESCDMDFCGG